MAGEMAKLHNVSKQTLIYYDKIGLFHPNEIIDETGYRYYSLEQFEDLDVILCLKNMGMPLKEIKGYLKQRATGERIRLLEIQKNEIQKKMDKIKSTQNRLQSILDSLKDRVNICTTKMGIRWIEERGIVSEPIESPFDMYALELAIKKLLKNTRERYDTDIHKLLVYTDSSPSNENLFRKVALQLQGCGDSGEGIAPGNYAYIYHKGSYQSLKDSRQKIKDYIETSGYRRLGPSIEKTLIDAFSVSSEADYLVEIQIPVEPRNPT
jgi:DNA-binding transcriptional MerR regulator